jgi:heat-inducible transcriptional repressor
MILPGNINGNLSGREQSILQTIIHLYILNASPVGSRNLSKHLGKELKLSPATIRNVMSDLEEMELISHPHTSAGRVPTDKGYRYYVDSLMRIDHLTAQEIDVLQHTFQESTAETVLKDASKLLGVLSHYLSIVEIPHLKDLILQKIELLQLSSTRILVVLALDSNIVKTLTLEAAFEVDNSRLDKISSIINEKISGRPLKFLRDNFADMIKEIDTSEHPIIRLFVESVDEIFNPNSTSDRLHIAGTQNLLNYPEFEDIQRIKGVIELVENEDIIVHLLDKYDEEVNGVRVLIGEEMDDKIFNDYSLIMTNYRLGNANGSIGLIGPKRMNYSKMFSLVNQIAMIISNSKL